MNTYIKANLLKFKLPYNKSNSLFMYIQIKQRVDVIFA